MHIIHSAALTAARSIWHAPSHYAQRRHLFRLPDLSSLPYPFTDPAGVKPQTYHEHKILPYVRAGNPYPALCPHIGELNGRSNV